MGKDFVTVTLCRGSREEAWGFRLAGGRDLGQPLSISQVNKDSLAAKVGLMGNDLLVSIADKEVFNLTHEEAERAIQEAGDRFQMVIERSTAGDRKISFEKSAMTVSLKLGGGGTQVNKVDEAFLSNVPVTEDTPTLLDSDQSVNFKKFEKTPADISASKTLQPKDMSKVYNRKDWNCPWVRKDGLGLKQAVRCVEEVVAPAKTSWQHFYSEPKSILSNEVVLTPEQLQEIIREHGAESRPESRNITDDAAFYQKEMEAALQEEMMQRQDRIVQHSREERVIQDETYTSKLVTSMQQDEMENSYYHDREEDSQAPPDLEAVTPQPADMVGDESGYEPSADELIEVLKNLENLAAANPCLYRTIVQQIKVANTSGRETPCGIPTNNTTITNNSNNLNTGANSGHGSQEQQQQQYEEQQRYSQQEAAFYQQEHMMNGNEEYNQYEEQFYAEQREQQMYEEQRMEQQLYEEQSSSTLEQHSSFQQQQQVESAPQVVETEEEKARRLKMERLEREAEEEVRQTLQRQKEIKMARLHPPAPPKPKEITVIAGDGKPVKILLGAEIIEDSRKQVAEAAGLKHVPLPDFDGDFSDSAWAGSLKRTEKSKHQMAKQENGDGGSPWAGSLRHVKEPRKKSSKKDDDDGTYGTAPWMGTLRHVVHDNKVTKNYGVNQFQSKRYPDEDAGNPFEAQGGIHARPAFPLTPAAIINGTAMSRDEMARREDAEEVSRIRDSIKLGGEKSETVSKALLNALMPKLLKMHESKYPAMDRDEASRIMEEILAMQVGLNVDQQADANEEAEMMIRAIMQDEIGKNVYSRMADDLEAASQRKKKEEGKRKVKKGKKQAGRSTPITA